MINIAILGFGVVGSGTAEVLTANKKSIEKRCGCEYRRETWSRESENGQSSEG